MFNGWIKFLTGQSLVQNSFEQKPDQIQMYRFTFLTFLNHDYLKGLTLISGDLLIRKYLLNIVNSVNPNSVVMAVIQIRRQRENK